MANDWINVILADEKNMDEIKRNLIGFDKNSNETIIDFNILIPKPIELDMAYGWGAKDFCNREENLEPLLEPFCKQTYKLIGEKGTYEDYLNILEGMWHYADNSTKINEIKQYFFEHHCRPMGTFFSRNVEVIDYLQTFKEYCLGYFNLQRYGYANWYRWSYENWGTKWNGYSLNMSDDKIEFYTANGCPFSIFSKLHDLGIEFTVFFANEDMGCGLGVIKSTKDSCNVYPLDEETFDFKTLYTLASIIRGNDVENTMSRWNEYDEETNKMTVDDFKNAIKVLAEFSDRFTFDEENEEVVLI